MFEKYVVIIFYVNLGLMICAAAHVAAVVGLCKKTAYRLVVGLTTVFLTFFSSLAYLTQLILYAYGNKYTPAAVIATLVMFAISFMTAGLYAGLLSRRSNRRRCIWAAVTAVMPPVGIFFSMSLMRHMRRDTHAQELVFNGYAYTIGALDAFCDYYDSDYIDSAGEESFERLTSREAMKHIKKLKKQAKDPDGMFRYAEAIAYYTPIDMRIASMAMHKAAKHGSAAAMFNLGYWHETGTYYKRDIKKAADYYKKAAELGDKDAEMRLAIVEIKTGRAAVGANIFRKKADEGDIYAKYNYAICRERGTCLDRQPDVALKEYMECADARLFTAQQRLFAMVSKSVNTVEHDDLFRTVTAHEFSGEFGHVMTGLRLIKEHRASDAAASFLDAVRCRGRWEGDARVFVGTLYMDCGKLEQDRRNGAAYVKSALDLTTLAQEIYFTLPKTFTGKKVRADKIRPLRAAAYFRARERRRLKEERDGKGTPAPTPELPDDDAKNV